MEKQHTDKSTLNALHDPMGAAILEYQKTGRAAKLRVSSSMFDDDEMPVPHLFRTADTMPPLERRALGMARGRTLDVGAGAGCHAIALQDAGIDVTAIDISPLACEAMRLRGVHNVACRNIFDPELTGSYDTIMLLMNGTGIAGRASRLGQLLLRLGQLLASGGQLLVDSSDLKYVYDNGDGSFDFPQGRYYGEVDYRMTYRNVSGQPFDWLYADYGLLASAAAECGMKCTLVAEGNHYDYLAAITK